MSPSLGVPEDGGGGFSSSFVGVPGDSGQLLYRFISRVSECVAAISLFFARFTDVSIG